MKNGALFIVCIFVRIEGMQIVERGIDSVVLPGTVCEETRVEDSQRAFDLQVADCIAELIQCSVNQSVFCHGTEDNVKRLFASIDDLDVNLLAYVDRRELGNDYCDKRRKNLEAELLKTLEQGGSFKELRLHTCLTRDLSQVAEDEKKPFFQAQYFYQKDMPLLLQKCSVLLLQRLINTDPELRKAIAQKKIMVDENLLWKLVRSEHPESVYDPLVLLCGAEHASELGANSSGPSKSPAVTSVQSNEQGSHASKNGYMVEMANKELRKGELQRQSCEGISEFVARIEMPFVLPQESRPPSALTGSASMSSQEPEWHRELDPFSDTVSPIPSESASSVEKKSKKSLSDYLCNCACL